MYIRTYILNIQRDRETETEQYRMRKTLVNTTNFANSFGCGRSQGVCCLYDF